MVEPERKRETEALEIGFGSGNVPVWESIIDGFYVKCQKIRKDLKAI